LQSFPSAHLSHGELKFSNGDRGVSICDEGLPVDLTALSSAASRAPQHRSVFVLVLLPLYVLVAFLFLVVDGWVRV